jgi:cell division protein ZapA (FtsZ GTPase activity inhibitor)
VDATKIAILAALNIADDYYQFRVRLSEGDPGRVAKRATRLVERLDEILGSPPGGVPAKAGEESTGALRGA